MNSLNIEEVSKGTEDQPSIPSERKDPLSQVPISVLGELMSHHKQLQSKEQNIKELQKQLNGEVM